MNANASLLVSTSRGTGWLEAFTGELHLAFGIHVSPRLAATPATPEQADAFFQLRAFHRQELIAYFNRSNQTGD